MEARSLQPIKIDDMLIKLLLYGPPKTMKTILACQFPEPVLVHDLDDGIKSARLFSKTADRDITYISLNPRIATLADLDKTIEEINTYKDKVGTLVVDSFSSLIEICHRHILRLNGHKLGAPKNFAIWEGTKDLFMSYVTPLMDWDCHFVGVAHEEHREDKQLGTSWIVPMLTGDHRHKLPIFFDDVWHTSSVLEKDGPTFYIETCASGRVVCGSRLGLIDTYETDFENIEAGLLERGIRLRRFSQPTSPAGSSKRSKRR